MSISTHLNLCERLSVKIARQIGRVALLTVLGAAMANLSATSQTTNTATNDFTGSNAPTRIESNSAPAGVAPTHLEPPSAGSAATPTKLDESVFSIIGERNIFNASRSGGQVRLSSRRPTRVESFTLVGTMAYEKGAFAFFNGSSSEFTKVVKADGVIAGHKLADIFADSVKLEADGKQIDLPIGSQMRREDAGTWKLAEGPSGNNDDDRSGSAPASPSRRNGDSSSRRSNGSDSAGKSPATSASATNADQSEILKRLMERREKE